MSNTELEKSLPQSIQAAYLKANPRDWKANPLTDEESKAYGDALAKAVVENLNTRTRTGNYPNY